MVISLQNHNLIKMKQKTFLITALAVIIFSSHSMKAQRIIYSENFIGQNGLGWDGTTTNTGAATWSLNSTGAATVANGSGGVVILEAFEVDRINGTLIWLSPILNIEGFSSIQASLNASSIEKKNGNLITLEYRVDGGVWTTFSTNGSLTGTFTNTTVSSTIPNGATLELRANTTQNGEASDQSRIDNINVTGTLDNLLHSNGSWNFTPDLTTGNTNIIIASNETVTFPVEVAAANLTVNSGATVTIAQLELSGNITNNGLINIPDNATLWQSAPGIDGNNGSGSYVVVRRHRVRDTTAISVSSSPVQSALKEVVFVQSPFVYDWDDENQRFLYEPNGVMEIGRGYSVTPNANPLNPTNFFNTVTFNGTINNGNLSWSIPNVVAGNFLQMGNPYPSSIDWNAFVALNNPNLLGTYYCWDETSSSKADRNYATFNGSGGTNGNNSTKKKPTQFVPAMQGLFVEIAPAFGNTPNTITLNYNNSLRNKTDNNSNNFRKASQEQRERVWLSLEGTQSKNQILLNLDNRASSNFDPLYDAKVLKGNPNHDIYFLSNNLELSILALDQTNAYPDPIKLGLDFWNTGSYQISIDSLYNWDRNKTIYLLDKSDNQYYNLSDDLSYNFTIDSVGSILNRFEIHLQTSNIGVNNTPIQDYNWYQKDNILTIIGDLSTFNECHISTLNGQLIYQKTITENKITSLQMELSDLNQGIYLVELVDKHTLKNNKKIKIFLN